MAFYRDTEKKSRQEKKTIAESRGGFEDEGKRYGRSATGTAGTQGRKPYGDKPAAARGGDRPRTGAPGRKPYGDRPTGDRPAGDRNYGDRPRTGAPGRKPYGDRPTGDRPVGDRNYGDRPRTGAPGRKPYGERTYGDNPRVDRYRGERPAVDAPRGERARMEPLPRGNRNASNEFRYQGRPERYSERGSGQAAPRSYDEQRRAREESREGAQRYERYRYAAPASYTPPVEFEEDVVPNENLLSGRNPIREALKSGRDIEKLMVQRGELSGSAREIIQMAKERHIPVQEVDRARLDAIAVSHQGMLAFASAYQYSTVEKMLELAEERGEQPFLVLLDGVTDPHNLGAIIRTVECAGAHGVIVQERRAVGLTPAAVKASAGAVEYVPVARVTNLASTIEMLQKQNVWVFAADMDGESYDQTDFTGAIALVIGAEGEGVSRLVLEKCDKTVSLPIRGKLDSLNASVAAGVLLYAIMRAR